MILRESLALNKSSYCEGEQNKNRKSNQKSGLLGEQQGSFHKSSKGDSWMKKGMGKARALDIVCAKILRWEEGRSGIAYIYILWFCILRTCLIWLNTIARFLSDVCFQSVWVAVFEENLASCR